MNHTSWSRWKAVFRQRCPRCLRGPIFRSRLDMHANCPQCDLRFEREQGYFMGALYFSYALSIVIMGALMGMGVLLFPELSLYWIIAIVAVLYVPLMPVVFRYGRVLWIHFDRWASP